VPQVRCSNLGLGVDVSVGFASLIVGLAMPTGLRRYYGKGDLHFITFSCYRRLPLLKTVRARDTFVKELGRVRDEMGVLPPGICGDAGTCTSLDERAERRNTFDRAA
jgi:hypothetical protein